MALGISSAITNIRGSDSTVSVMLGQGSSVIVSV